ncbi:hypothetical protein [Yersinia kristensenii]|uniref:hypothetical protein n=1 Tax=Yersinia kristensenii TaxID=28152 RepID=UPI0015621B10|nr:hypothetical protein [Yersinia kristensenii]QKJ17459.1 hypothetical protein HRD70_21090 [Yersinia kristensenii]
MMGLSSVMLIAGFLSTTLNYRIISVIACIPPVVLSLSLSSAYGNASKSQRSLEEKVFYDITTSIPESWGGYKIYLSGNMKVSQTAEMEFRRFPALKLMVMPLNSWSGMVMLKHYGINVEMRDGGLASGTLISGTKYFKIYDGSNKEIILK